MDIIKAATDWTKAEIFSAQFFIFFGILFLLGSVGFWQWARTEVAKAYIFPSLVAGALLLAADCSFYFTISPNYQLLKPTIKTILQNLYN